MAERRRRRHLEIDEEILSEGDSQQSQLTLSDSVRSVYMYFQ